MEVLEELWGKLDSRIVKVTMGDAASNEPVFIAAPREDDGTFRVHPGCSIGLMLSPHDPWVQLFRYYLANRAPASIPIRTLAAGFLPISGVKLTLASDRTSLSGTSGGVLGLEFPLVPAGTYRITTQTPGFRYAGPQEISILPGSCATLKVAMKSASSISGTLTNTNGEPIRKATLLLQSTIRGDPWNGSVYDSWADSLLDWTWRSIYRVQSGREYSYQNLTHTDNSGRFRFEDVFPGYHYLRTYPSVAHPEMYYPAARNWTEATPIVVRENQSVDGLAFRIP